MREVTVANNKEGVGGRGIITTVWLQPQCSTNIVAVAIIYYYFIRSIITNNNILYNVFIIITITIRNIIITSIIGTVTLETSQTLSYHGHFRCP